MRQKSSKQKDQNGKMVVEEQEQNMEKWCSMKMSLGTSRGSIIGLIKPVKAEHSSVTWFGT